MSTDIITRTQWRALYRNLLKAVSQATGDRRPLSRVLMVKIRQGFDENTSAANTKDEIESFYRRGYNTLSFLKLSHEIESIENKILHTIIFMYKRRELLSIKPQYHRRRLRPHQTKIYDSVYDEYDHLIERIADELEIILPLDKFKSTLDMWIPPLNNLHKGDPILEQIKRSKESESQL